MVDTIELQDPIGPGAESTPQPEPVPVPTPQRSLTPDPNSEYGSMDWFRSHRMPTASMFGALDPEGPGSQLFEPTGDLLAHQMDPTYFTDTPDDLFTPPVSASSLAKPGERARPGQLSLDLIDPASSINEFGLNTLGGQYAQAGDAIGAYLNTRDVDFFSWDIGSRIMDYALADFVVSKDKLFGEPLPGDDQNDEQFYRFQTNPGYWQWLTTATPEQLTQQARQWSAAYGGGNGGAMFDGVLAQMTKDQQQAQGLATGDTRINYLAATSLIKDFRGVRDPYTGPQDLRYQKNLEWYGDVESETARFMSLAQDEGLGISYENARAFIERGWEAAPYGDLERASIEAGELSTTGLPIIGTELGRWIRDPAGDPFMRTFWRWADPEARREQFGKAGITTMASDFIGTLAISSGIGAIAAVAASAPKATAAARLFTAYDWSLKVGKIAMTVGITRAITNWGLSIASPVYYENWGKYVDAARPVSDSALAGIANAVGAFATGSWGIIPAYQVTRRGAGALIAGIERVTPIRVPSLGDLEPAIVRYGFGSGATIGRAWQDMGLPEQLRTNAIQRTFLSYMTNAYRRYKFSLWERNLNNERGRGWSEMEALSPDDRIARIQQAAMDADMNTMPMVENVIKLWNAGRRELGIRELFDDATIQAHKAAKQIHRTMDDSVIRNYLADYDLRFGATVSEIKQITRQRLDRIYQELPEFRGREVPWEALEARLKNNRDAWRMMASSAHGVLFDIKNSRLYDAVRSVPSREGEGLHMMSLDTLTKQDVTDDVLDTLRGGGDAAEIVKAQLMSRHEVTSFLRQARNPNPTPSDLADMLEQMRNALPSRRVNVTDEADPTYNQPINEFQRGLEEEGVWTLGFKPTMDEAGPDPLFFEVPDFRYPPPGIERQSFTDPSQVPIEDGVFRRTVDGEVFRKGARRYIYTWTDGVYVNEVPGEVVGVTGAGARAGNMDPLSPHVMGDIDAAEWTPAEADLGASWRYIDNNGNIVSEPYAYQLEDTGSSLYGQNAGAQWPVLRNPTTGEEWLFKARRSAGGLVDLADYRAFAGTTATKMFNYLGLKSGIEMNFSWNGVTGTIQPKYDLTPVDLRDLSSLPKEQLAQLQQHHLVDWWLGQHDTNNTSVFTDISGDIVAVDKGQAFKWYGHAGEWPPDMGFTPPDKANDRLDDFFYSFINQGGLLDRGAIEATLQKIEAIPENVLRNWLSPLAEARARAAVKDPSRWLKQLDGSPTPQPVGVDLIEDMLMRRRQLREAVNEMYAQQGGIRIEAPGKVQRFATKAHGTYVIEGNGAAVNEPPGMMDLQMAQDYAKVYPINEPDHDPFTITKAGVVIKEPDGRIWVVAPTNQYAEYLTTFPKGHIEAGETPAAAAIREAFEEAGFIVRLERHLFDWNDTRYYVAERTGGGPRFAPDMMSKGYPESEAVWLGTPEQLQPHLEAKTNGVANDRDIAVLQEWLGGANQSANNPSHTLGQAPDPTSPGATTTEQPKRYVTYAKVTLPGGEKRLFQAPWLDYPIEAPSTLHMGNRSLVGAKMDEVFRTWRSWRLTQYQKVGLYTGMAGRFAGVNVDQAMAFHDELSDLAHGHRWGWRGRSIPAATSVQGLVLTGSNEQEVIDAAERIFGKHMTPLDGSDPIPVADVDWSDIIVRAYRQAPKLNFAAGLTSAFYTLPVAGQAAGLLGQIVWPLIKFGLSPLFKGGEYAESLMFNLMRGVGAEDPGVTQLFLNHGMTPSADQGISEELGFEPYVTAITGVGSYNPLSSMRGRQPGLAAFLQTQRESGIRFAVRNAEKVGQMPRYPATNPAGVAEYLDSFFIAGDANRYPPTYSSSTPEFLLPTRTEEPDGPRIVSFDATQRDRAWTAAASQDVWINRPITDSQSAHEAAQGLAVLDQLGFDNIDRLIDALPLVSAVRRSSFFRDMAANAQTDFIVPTNPTAGKTPIRIEKSLAGPTMTTGVGNTYSIGGTEYAMGMGNARYGSWGTFSTGWGEVWLILKKDVMLPRDTITTTDRISSSPSNLRSADAAGTVLLSPMGALSAMRMQIINTLKRATRKDTLGSLLQQASIGPSSPTEHAFFDGHRWTDVEAAYMSQPDADEWNQIVNGLPPEHPAHAIEVRIKAASSAHDDAWRYAFEKAGLLDRWDEAINEVDIDDLLPLMKLDPQQMSTRSLEKLNQQIEFRLRGFNVSITTEKSLYSQAQDLLDLNRRQLEGHLGAEADRLTQQSYGSSHAPLDERMLRERTESIRAGEEAMRDLKAWATDPANPWATVDDAIKAQRDNPAAIEWSMELNALQARLEAALNFKAKGYQRPVHDVLTDGAERHVMPIAEGDRRAWSEEQNGILKHWMTQRGIPSTPGVYEFNYLSSLDQSSLSSSITPLAPMEFRDKIRELATNKLGYDPGSPQMNVYLRGSTIGITSGPAHGDVELVFVLRSPDNKSLGLSFHEMQEAWNETGLPSRGLVEATIYRNNRNTTLRLGWDQAANGGQGGVLMHIGDQPPASLTVTKDPDGRDVIMSNESTIPVVFLDHFDNGGQSWAEVGGMNMYSTENAVERVNNIGSHNVSYTDSNGFKPWNYDYDPSSAIATVHADSIPMARMLFRDLTSRIKGKGSFKVVYDAHNSDMWERAIAAAWYKGELPNDIVFTDNNGNVFGEAQIQQHYGAPSGATATRVPDLEAIPGTTEWMHQHLKEQLQKNLGVAADEIEGATPKRDPKRTMQRLLSDLWNPVPWKELRQTQLAIKMANPIFVGAMKEGNPAVYRLLHEDMKVPDDDILTFYLEDNRLLNTWIGSHKREDLDALIAHADKYTGGVDPTYQAKMDELRMSPEYHTITQLWWLTIKTAQDESFGVHFFNPYRSTLERSINHPVFGIYPLSWSLKAAREWGRFLFDNRVLANGNLRLGMAPALAVSELSRRMAIMWAQQENGEGTLGELLGTGGPLGSALLAFNLVMPGDWSSIPFPLSRAIRDLIRPGFNIGTTLESYLSAGVGRDLELLSEGGGEAADIARNWLTGGPEPEEPEPRDLPPSIPGRYVENPADEEQPISIPERYRRWD